MDGIVCSGGRDGCRVRVCGSRSTAFATSTPRRLPHRAAPRSSSPQACCSGALLIGLAALRGMPNWQSIPSNWDAVWHANTIRFILDTGQASPTHMGELRNVETHEALYYPSTFHALAAVFSSAHRRRADHRLHAELSGRGGLAVPGRARATLTWQLLRSRTDEWRTAGAAATAAALSASFTAIPYIEFDTASMPNLAAYGVAVPTMVLVVSALRHRDRIPLAVLALLGVFSVHITGGVVAVLFVVGVVAVRRAVASRPRPARGLRQPVGHRHADGAAAAAAVPRRAAAGRDHRRARVRHPRGQEARADRRGRAAHPAPQRLPHPVGADHPGRASARSSCWSAGLVAAGGMAAAGGVDRAFVGAVRRPDRRAHRQVQRPVLQRPAAAVGGDHDAAHRGGRHRACSRWRRPRSQARRRTGRQGQSAGLVRRDGRRAGRRQRRHRARVSTRGPVSCSARSTTR